MKIHTNTFILNDHIKIFYRQILNDNPENTIVVFHGIGIHSKYYLELAKKIYVYSSSTIFLVDMLGHGRSDGIKGILPNKNKIIEIINEILIIINKKFPNSKIHIIGESMGGIFSILYLSKYSDNIVKSAILIAPGLELKINQISNIKTLKDLFLSFFNPFKNLIPLTNDRLNDVLNDDIFKNSIRNDPLSLKKVSLKYFIVLFTIIINWGKKYPSKINTPVCIIHGSKDRLINLEGSKKLYNMINSVKKEIHIINNAPHGLLWSKYRDEVFEIVIKWINKI